MTTASPPSHVDHHESEKARPPGYNTMPGRFHFALRRLHSLVGLVFGGYIAVHLSVNAAGLSPAMYQGFVNHIHGLEPALPFIEIATIFLPILIHALYGIYITMAGVKFNTIRYNYLGNLRFSLQRYTAIILLAFLAFHIGTLHKWGLGGIHRMLEHVEKVPDPLPTNDKGDVDYSKLDALQKFSNWCHANGDMFQAENAYQSTVSGIRTMFYDPAKPDSIGWKNMLVMGFYLVGIWCATFHFANGLWTSAIAWGLTTSAKSQKRWGHLCFGFFLALTIIGTTAWFAFTLLADPTYTLPTN